MLPQNQKIKRRASLAYLPLFSPEALTNPMGVVNQTLPKADRTRKNHCSNPNKRRKSLEGVEGVEGPEVHQGAAPDAKMQGITKRGAHPFVERHRQGAPRIRAAEAATEMEGPEVAWMPAQETG
jgi:hypothetical protein